MTGTCAVTIAKTVTIVALYLGFVLAVARLASSKWHPDGGKVVFPNQQWLAWEPIAAEVTDDG